MLITFREDDGDGLHLHKTTKQLRILYYQGPQHQECKSHSDCMSLKLLNRMDIPVEWKSIILDTIQSVMSGGTRGVRLWFNQKLNRFPITVQHKLYPTHKLPVSECRVQEETQQHTLTGRFTLRPHSCSFTHGSAVSHQPIACITHVCSYFSKCCSSSVINSAIGWVSQRTTVHNC